MAWHTVLQSLAANIGISLEAALLLIIVLGSLIFMAKDFKLGMLMLFIMSGLLTMLFYNYQVNFYPSLIVFFMSLVILAFSFYAVAKSSKTGSGIG